MSTTNKSKNFSAKAKKALDRPFAPAILAKARKIASQYQVVIWLEEDGDWYGRGVELPNTVDDGKTSAECVKKVQQALVGTVAWMLEEGQTPPPPASAGIRTEQINIRLTAEEKLALETAARQHGDAGISDYVRTAALEKIGSAG